jgi:hypothetical protein
VTGHILLAIAAIAVYAALRLAFPTSRCPRCWGKRITRHGRRASKCPLCHEHGRVVWPGATAVHRFWWSVLGHRLMDRRKGTIKARITGEDR